MRIAHGNVGYFYAHALNTYMNFFYEATGGISLTGSACPIQFDVNCYHKFELGSRMYVLPSARRGIIESIIIKDASILSDSCGIINYIDTFNRVWMEEELIDLSEAQYYADKKKKRADPPVEEEKCPPPIYHKFEIGARMYILPSARNGKIESIIIKDINISNKDCKVVNYIDTFNRVWMEEELIDLSEAQYYADKKKKRTSQPVEEIYLIPINCRKFQERTTVYLKDKAAKHGVLENVYIKKINKIDYGSPNIGYENIINYVDSFNRIWMEEELVHLEEAMLLIDKWYEKVGLPSRGSITKNGKTFIVSAKKVKRPRTAKVTVAKEIRRKIHTIANTGMLVFDIGNFLAGSSRIYLNGSRLNGNDYKELTPRRVQVLRTVMPGDMVVTEAAYASKTSRTVEDFHTDDIKTDSDDNLFEVGKFRAGTVAVYLNGQRAEETAFEEVIPDKVRVLDEIRNGDTIIIDYHKEGLC